MITEKFKNLFDFAKKSKVKAGDGLEKGSFSFFTSSSILSKRIDKAQHNDEALIFGTGGSASVHFADEPFSTSTDCIVAITNTEELNTKFVYYYLYGNLHILERGFKGAGLKHISKKYIENIDIPILPLETQNKIVDVLDRANSLVKKREQTIEILDELLRATFLNMFGDPVINDKDWKVITMNQAVQKITSGVSYGGDEKKELSEDELGVIKISAVTSGVFNPNEFKAVSKKDIKKRIIPAAKGQFLISRANTRELVAACCIVPEDFPKLFLPDKLWSLTIDENRITKEFLNHLLKSENYRNTVRRKASGGHSSMLNISQKKFMDLPLVQPPIEIQLRFDKSVEKIEGIKSKFSISLQNTENVFSSITQKVYNGELNFNIDFELDALVRKVDLEKKQNDLSKIGGDIAYLQRLVDKLNAQEFEEKEMYDKAKHAAFQLLKEDEKITQEYSEQNNNVKLVLK